MTQRTDISWEMHEVISNRQDKPYLARLVNQSQHRICFLLLAGKGSHIIMVLSFDH